MSNKIEEYVQRFATAITTQRHISALRDGMTATMPLLLIGSIFMLISKLFCNNCFFIWNMM